MSESPAERWPAGGADDSLFAPENYSPSEGIAGGVTEQFGRVLANEMRRRWRRGDRPPAEEFLSRHPQLLERPEAAFELIYEEYCLRLSQDDADAEQDILRRFPQWAGPLRVMLDCHRALQSDRDLPKLPVVGDTVGEFRLLAELGRGSRGRVFLATQTALADRPVVLKITPVDGAEHLSLARMQHTNIVPLHSVVDDTTRAIRILCMPYFGRATLASLLRSSSHSASPAQPAARTGQFLVDAIDRMQEPASLPVSPAGAVRQMLSHVSYVRAMCWITTCLADALDFAHQRGMVHLDLKPSNVLLASDGTPMLLDFHLAREPLRPGAPAPEYFGGTPGYMSPEQQAAMRSLHNGHPIEDTVDGRADIYALGAMLYESLGGRLPIVADSPPLSQVNAQVSVGLSDVVGKCVAASPADRYQSAGALADDLRRHGADLPLVGVPNRSLRERWHKWRRRRPSTLRIGAMLSAVASAAVILGVGKLSLWRDCHDQAERALRDGADQLQNRRYGEAVQTFERGFAMAENLPFHQDLRSHLRGQCAAAKRLHVAQQLHELAEEIRVLYGTDSIPPARLRTLAAYCRSFWAKRDIIVNSSLRLKLPQRPGLAELSSEDMATDLLDIAIFAADLEIKSQVGPDSHQARHDALRILDEAEAMFGTSAVLEYERQIHRRTLGLPHAPTSESPGLRLDALIQGIDPESVSQHTADGRNTPFPSAHLVLPTPRTGWEHYALGRAYLASDQLERAAEELAAALEQDPAGLWPNFYYGLCAYRMRRYEDAVEAFGVCIGAAPNIAGCFYNHGLALAALGRTGQAIVNYDRALEIDSTHAAAALNRAMLRYEQRQFDKAIADLHLALEHGADPASVHYNLALVHMAVHDDAALDDVERALEFNPAHELARRLRDKLRNGFGKASSAP
jgi:serine/threonine protein kinase/Tfp pilus assembly protein PilF